MIPLCVSCIGFSESMGGQWEPPDIQCLMCDHPTFPHVDYCPGYSPDFVYRCAQCGRPINRPVASVTLWVYSSQQGESVPVCSPLCAIAGREVDRLWREEAQSEGR